MSDTALLRTAYAPLIEFAEVLDDERGWRPTALPGWTVRDLLLHLTTDAQRGLVALHTPTDRPVDTDEVGYWSHWQPGGEAARSELRATRIHASAWSSVAGPARLFTDTARAVLHAAAAADATQVVETQGHAETVATLVHTLAVEAAVHHLDLGGVLPEPPALPLLTQVRRVIEALIGAPMPLEMDESRVALLGTGRVAPTAAEREALGHVADRLPAFG